jgi:hypothetical protein
MIRRLICRIRGHRLALFGLLRDGREQGYCVRCRRVVVR